MKALHKVIWAEGMFLGQQHFQLWDQYYENYHSLHVRSLSPMGWGLLRIEVDEEALENGQFRLNDCQAIFPDGRLISYNIADDVPLVMELDGGFSEQIDIYLCMPVNRSASGISGYRESGNLCAWHADYKNIQDENDPAREREVMLGRPNLMLIKGDESRENFSSLKLAEVVNDGDGNYSVIEEFIPPVVRIQASKRLFQLCQSVIELFSAKVRVLNERRSQLSASVATFGHTDVSNFLILQTLSGAIPLLRHYRDNPDLHPEQLYQLLVRVIGALAPFSFDIDIRQIPKYRHANLTLVYDEVEQQLRNLVEVAMPEKMTTVKLVKEADLLYVADNIESKYLTNNHFYLAVLSPMDDPMWVKHFEKIVKVSARADIEMIVASALPGIRITHQQRPPSNLPIKSGYEYFRIEPHGEFWTRVTSERTLAFYMPKAFMRAKMEIVLVPKE